MQQGNVAIIPARGGSKRIPRKNIKDFLGKPIIEYSIDSALRSKLFERVIVSTDSLEIAEIAKKAGAEVPFMRSDENANDFAGTVEVLLEVVDVLTKTGFSYKNLCCLYPTAPFITPSKLQMGYELLTEGKFDTVFPVCQFGYPILRALQIDKNGKVQMIWPENLKKRSQDLGQAYHDAGQFYWATTNAILNKKSLFTDNSGCLILSEVEVQDIDNMQDWEMAEIKFKKLALSNKSPL